MTFVPFSIFFLAMVVRSLFRISYDISSFIAKESFKYQLLMWSLKYDNYESKTHI